MGHVIVLTTQEATFSLSPHGGTAAIIRPALHIPLDPLFRRRTNEAMRFSSVALGFSLPTRHPRRITQTRHRWLLLRLHAYDLRRAGASQRQIASLLLDPAAMTMPDGVWGDSALRAMARALRDEGSTLVHGGYVTLLDGI
ncbi:DUF2285 domain-containing protein [Acetobacter senegalensis]|uniref:DUF2285 domain-containing protein n=1 Tax=Acetobacter senegalensis TaxID=446692 RepID=UPI00341DE312